MGLDQGRHIQIERGGTAGYTAGAATAAIAGWKSNASVFKAAVNYWTRAGPLPLPADEVRNSY